MQSERNGRARLYKNIKSRREFDRRVDILWEGDYEERELEEFPTTVFGGFAPWRVDDFLRLASRHPEYHIVTCIGPELFINAFVKGALSYFLAEGDSDPKLIHDPYDKLDVYLLHSLNSDRKRRAA